MDKDRLAVYGYLTDVNASAASSSKSSELMDLPVLREYANAYVRPGGLSNAIQMLSMSNTIHSMCQCVNVSMILGFN